MKFIVDFLPYYNEECILADKCKNANSIDCPKNWDEDFICSSRNPHECELLKAPNEITIL